MSETHQDRSVGQVCHGQTDSAHADGSVLEHGRTKALLDAVVFGGTNRCNASCIHCPTNKPETSARPSGVMPLDVFCTTVDQLAESYTISRWLALGLFGDALLDPLIVERAQYVKCKLPDVMLSINTNGAAYSPARHASLAQIVDAFSVHVESLRSDVYNYVMQPLRIERVFEKIDLIIRDFGAKVNIAAPLHRLNILERDSIRSYFLGRGCGEVIFGPLTNRCSATGVFEQLALAPVPHPCNANVIRNFVVDWDGTVLLCANDMRRIMPIGRIQDSSVRELIESPLRLRLGEQIERGDLATIPTCRTCYADLDTPLTVSEPRKFQPCSGKADQLPQTTTPGGMDEEIARLKAELTAVYSSTSWRVTSALRALRRRVDR